MPDRITIAEAAMLLGMSPHDVRNDMKNNMFDPPIGRVDIVGGTHNIYNFYRDAVKEYLDKKARR